MLLGTGCSFFLLLPAGLLEFRAVALKTIAIKDVSSVRYLCMSADGKIQGLVSVPHAAECSGPRWVRVGSFHPLLGPKGNVEGQVSSASEANVTPPPRPPRKVMAPGCSGGLRRPAEHV